MSTVENCGLFYLYGAQNARFYIIHIKSKCESVRPSVSDRQCLSVCLYPSFGRTGGRICKIILVGGRASSGECQLNTK